MNNDEKGFRSCQECLDAVNEERQLYISQVVSNKFNEKV